MKTSEFMSGWTGFGRVFAAGALCAVLASCQTTGSDGVLGSAAEDAKQQETANARPLGRNPNAVTNQINTRTALTDYCPALQIRAGTETFRVFPQGANEEDPDQLRFQATITKSARECSYVGDELQIRVGARGRVINGPSGATGSFQMPIRVAVTEGGDTIYSKLYKEQAQLSGGQSSQQFSFVDENVVIPAPKRTNVKIYIGFDPGPYNTP